MRQYIFRFVVVTLLFLSGGPLPVPLMAEKRDTNVATLPANRIVKGKVVDEQGKPMPGVTVRIKGTQMGTSTNVDGYFELPIPEGKYSLIFSFIGFRNRELIYKINNPAGIFKLFIFYPLGRNSSVSTQRMNEISLINEVLIGDRNEHLSFRTGVWGSSPAGRAIDQLSVKPHRYIRTVFDHTDISDFIHFFRISHILFQNIPYLFIRKTQVFKFFVIFPYFPV